MKVEMTPTNVTVVSQQNINMTGRTKGDTHSASRGRTHRTTTAQMRNVDIWLIYYVTISDIF